MAMFDDQAPQGGLLGFMSTPTGQGLLSAVATGLATARRGRPLNNIGAGLLGGVQGYQQAQDNAQQMAFNQTRQKLLNSQVTENDLQAKLRQQALDQQQAQRNYLGSIGKVTSPRMDAQPNKFDPMTALSLGMSPEMVKTVAEAPNLGRTEVARTIEGQDDQGNKVTYQYDKYGQLLGNGVQGYTAPVQVDLGGKVAFVKPQGGITLGKSMTPGEAASNSIARQRLAFDQQGKPEYKDGQWVMPPKGMTPGSVLPVMGGQVVKDANDALALIRQARKVLPNSTGSYGGMAYDQGARFFGHSTEGAQAAAKLKAIGGMLVSKMPKMSGPQSDADVKNYKEMAGRVGDETLPIVERAAALDAVEEIQNRYASGQAGMPQPKIAPTKNATGLQFLGFE